MLQVEHLYLNIQGKDILKDIHMELPCGEIVAILGSSGAGKSSLLRCAGHLQDPTSGTITFKNTELKSLDKGSIGFVFQGFHLFPHLTVMQNIVLAPRYIKKWDAEICHEIANALCEQLDIWHLKDRYPHELSGGQKQRVSIARSLVMSPSLVLFDEPTSALDPELVDEVGNLILSLKAKERLILVVTHEIRLAKLIADRILFMDDGKILDNVKKEDFFHLSLHSTGEESDDRVLSERARSFIKRVFASFS